MDREIAVTLTIRPSKMIQVGTDFHYGLRISAPVCGDRLVVRNDEEDYYFNTAAKNPKIFVSCYKSN